MQGRPGGLPHVRYRTPRGGEPLPCQYAGPVAVSSRSKRPKTPPVSEQMKHVAALLEQEMLGCWRGIRERIPAPANPKDRAVGQVVNLRRIGNPPVVCPRLRPSGRSTSKDGGRINNPPQVSHTLPRALPGRHNPAPSGIITDGPHKENNMNRSLSLSSYYLLLTSDCAGVIVT